jgi:hypothetical protein
VSAQKQYLLELQAEGSNIEEQDAIEWAVYSNWVKLTWDLETDRKTVAEQLPVIIQGYRRLVADMEAADPMIEAIQGVYDQANHIPGQAR